MVKSDSAHIAIVFGTSAELIKLWPIIVDLSSLTEVALFSMDQQPVELVELCHRLDLQKVEHLRSPSTGNLVNRSDVPAWALATGWRLYRRLRKIKRINGVNKEGTLVIVHGDTMSCLVGAATARLARCRVAHIEAGLRSHDWRNPFPEELDRILTARLADIHFCPDEIAVGNLRSRGGLKVNTGGNTSRDSMMRIKSQGRLTIPSDPYILVSLHRAELLSTLDTLRQTVTEIVEVAEERCVVMVVDAVTRRVLTDRHLWLLLEDSNVDLRSKMPYPDFLQLLSAAERVVTDSGGLQEECGFIRLPCLVHRKATERFDGLGETAKLSMWEPRSIIEFCGAELPRSASSLIEDSSSSPTGIIIDTLKAEGYLSRAVE